MSRHGERAHEVTGTATSHLLTQVVSGTLTVAEAAVQMGVCERQAKRVLAGFRRDGVVAVVHGNRGRQPAYTVPSPLWCASGRRYPLLPTGDSGE